LDIPSYVKTSDLLNCSGIIMVIFPLMWPVYYCHPQTHYLENSFLKKFKSMWNRGSSVSIETWLQAGRQGFDYRQGHRLFLFVTASRPALGPTQPHIQWMPGALAPVVKLISI
jgi:hypothetical protein